MPLNLKDAIWRQHPWSTLVHVMACCPSSRHHKQCWIWFQCMHDDVIKWKHFPRCWPFVRGIHRSPVNSPHKGQWRGALIFSSICVWINGWVNNREAGDLRRYRAHFDVTVMCENVVCKMLTILFTSQSRNNCVIILAAEMIILHWLLIHTLCITG